LEQLKVDTVEKHSTDEVSESY